MPSVLLKSIQDRLSKQCQTVQGTLRSKSFILHSIYSFIIHFRYFVIQVQDDGGKIAHLGLGFADRSDSFDLNVSLQDHFKSVKVEEAIQKEEEQPVKQLDLAFKEGETIKVNINIPRKGGKERSKSPGRGGGVLPPPTAAEMSRAVAAAGIQVNTEPRIAAPPGKQTNPNWIQF